MKYDPNNELTQDEIDNLMEDEFFEYLDTKAEYLKQFTKPLGEYHTKRYVSLAARSSGKELTQKEFDTAKQIGKDGDVINKQRIIDKMNGKALKEPNTHVTNHKTHRSQWFD